MAQAIARKGDVGVAGVLAEELAATGEIPPEVVAVLSKPPRLSELRQKLAECVGELAEKDAS